MAKSGTANFYNGVATQSLRFNDDDSAYLSRTPSSASNRRTFTFSAWVKLNPSATNYPPLFNANASSPDTVIRLDNVGKINVALENGSSGVGLTTSAQLRDPSSFYNITVAVDTTNSTENDRIKIYINGTEQTSYSSRSNPTLNYDTNVNNTVLHKIGAQRYASYWDGYMSDVNFIDGLALTPTSFGEFKNGVWIPIDTSGLTFGTNGFRLKFNSSDFNEDGSAVTDPYGSGTDVPDDDVADASGSGNHFSVSGLVTSDFGIPDSPENNFPTMNPLKVPASNLTTLSEGNLKCVGPAPGTPTVLSTMAIPTSGKWYAEFERTVQYNGVGIVKGSIANIAVHAGVDANGYVYYDTGGAKYNNNSSASYGSSWSNGTIIGVAYNADDGELTFYQDNSSQGVAYSSLSGEFHFCWSDMGNNANPAGVWNFGSDSSFAGNSTAQGNTDGNGIGDFYYAPPSGYLALCSANLPEPTIGANSGDDEQADNYFGILTWSGDNDARDISTSASGITGTVDFTPDWAWIKRRNGSSNGSDHLVIDSVRGVNGHKGIAVNGAAREGHTEAGSAWTNFGDIVSFKAGGFNGSASGTEEAINQSGGTYVAWNWKAGGAPTATNSAGVGEIPTEGSVKIDGANKGDALTGSIMATKISANTTAGFSIVTHTGTGSAGTVDHGLGAKPSFIITKGLSDGYNWFVYNQVSGATKALILSNSGADTAYSTVFNNTEPDTSLITFGTATATNGSGINYVSYVISEIAGYSKIGVYAGGGSGGEFVYLGFRPAWVMIKSTSASTQWLIFDSTRSPFNLIDDVALTADALSGEGFSSGMELDFLSNGFKIRGSNNDISYSGKIHLYIAFAESPFKYANAR